MSRPKWKKSKVMIKSLSGIEDSLDMYGGVYIWKFMNSAWVLSQQLRTLKKFIGRGKMFFPERIGENTK